MIEPGTSATIGHTVGPKDTAVALRSGDVPVLGTPKVIALVEEAAVAALAGAIPEASTTVGMNVAVDHTAPTPVGGWVEATATVTIVDGRQVGFAVVVKDGERTVASGTHTRAIVDRSRFLDAVR